MDSALETSVIIKMQNMNVGEASFPSQQQIQETVKPIIRAEFQEPLQSASSNSPNKTPTLTTE